MGNEQRLLIVGMATGWLRELFFVEAPKIEIRPEWSFLEGERAFLEDEQHSVVSIYFEIMISGRIVQNSISDFKSII